MSDVEERDLKPFDQRMADVLALAEQSSAGEIVAAANALQRILEADRGGQSIEALTRTILMAWLVGDGAAHEICCVASAI